MRDRSVLIGWRGRRVVRGLALGLTAMLLVVIGVVREAASHAAPVSVEPAENAVLAEAPHEVVIRFSERVDPRASTLEVLDGHGQRVDHGGATVDPADPWRSFPLDKGPLWSDRLRPRRASAAA